VLQFVEIALNGIRLELSAVDWYCRVLGELVRRLIAGIILCGTVVAAHNATECANSWVLPHVFAGSTVRVPAACVHIKLQSNCSNYVDPADYNIKQIK
jgi:hypothetical protein